MRTLSILSFFAGTLCAPSLAAQPDLAVTFINAAPNPVVPGSFVDLWATIRNVGPFGTANFWDDRVVVRSSSGAVLNSFSMRLTFGPIFSNGEYGPGLFGSGPLSVHIPPSASGSVTVTYEANHTRSPGWAVPETNYANNSASVTLTIARPDLEVQSVATQPSGSVRPGSAIDVRATVRNVGHWGTDQTWRDRVLYKTSPNGAVRPLADFPLHFPNFILPGQSYGSGPNADFGLQPVRVVLPGSLPNGPLWIGYEANSSHPSGWPIPEANLGNNIAWTQLTVCGRPDFTISGMSVPDYVAPQSSVSLSAAVDNLGCSEGNAAIAVRFDVLDRNGALLASATSPTQTVAAGASRAFAATVVMPFVNPQIGSVRAVADAMSAVAETDEGNNERTASATIAEPPAFSPFGSGCAPSGGVVPTLTALTSPLRGADLDIEVGNALPVSTAYLLVGPAVPTPPVSLAIIGFPNCSVLVAPFASPGMLVDGAGTATFRFPLANEPGLLGLTLHLQAAVTSLANLALTEGALVRIG